MSSPDYKAMFHRSERLRLEAEDAARRAGEAATEKDRQIQETERRAAAEIAARDVLLEDKDRKLEDKDLLLEDKDRKLEDKDRELEEERLLTRPTTLAEYLDLCHTYLFNPITIQPDKALSSQGDGTTSNANKTRPNRLRHWDTFLETQQSTIERLLDTYPLHQPRVFENRAFLQTYGDRVAARLLACEPDLQSLERETVETPVARIMDHLHTLADVREEFNLTSQGITFYSHPNAMSDGTEEVVKRLQQQSLVPSTPPRRPTPSTQSTTPTTNLKPDQICVYSFTSGNVVQRKLAFVIEYKPPHKVTSPILRLGFRDMDIADIINCQLIPTSDDEAKFRYHADRIVASIATQTFAYMIQGGAQYGYITSGVDFVFLYIPADDPGTLYYHLSEPRNDVDAQKMDFPDTQDYIYQTAVSQVTAFSLLALESQSLRSDTGDSPWQPAAIESLNTWVVDPRAIWEDMPQSLRSTPPSSPYITRTSCPARSPKKLRPRDASGRACAPPTKPKREEDEHSDQSDSELQRRADTPSKSRDNRKTTTTTRSSSSKTTSNSSQAGQRSRSFCSQHCLRGLVGGWLLDSACPNISDHRGLNSKATRHQLSQTAFLALLRAQLARSLDSNCLPLGFQGARGALFKVTLASHGYTMVAKGTVLAFLKDLQWEAQVYNRLTPIQGSCVPVCVGSIDLVNPYYYDMGVRIIHLMLLSWAGDCLFDGGGAHERDRSELAKDIAYSIRAIHRAGVLHRDVRTPNLCWNSEVGGIMFIDFERAELLSQGQMIKRRTSNGSHSRNNSSDDTRLAQEVLEGRRIAKRHYR